MEQALIKQAINAFNKKEGPKLTLDKPERKINKTRYADAVIQLERGNFKKTYAVECRYNLTPEKIGIVLQQLRELPIKALLVADYINPATAAVLVQNRTPFIDTAGNAYIDEEPIYIQITGIKQKNFKRKHTGQALRTAGLKVLFTLLCDPERLNHPLREIAKGAGVALGTAAKVIADLKARKRIAEVLPERWRFTRQGEDIKEWAILYPVLLRPKLLIGHYQIGNDTNDFVTDWATKLKLSVNAFWGGEVAADKYTEFLKPEHATIYTLGREANFVVENRLREDQGGPIEVLKAFWDVKLNSGQFVPPLLVYADLMATGDPRNIEVANTIYERRIAENINND